VNIHYPNSRLPLLAQGDAVVVGGSLAGVCAALALAAAGRTVTLIDPRTYLGSDVTATMRPWLPAPQEGALPPVLAACVEAGSAAVPSADGGDGAGEIALHMDGLKTVLEDLLLAAGVKILYSSLPVGILAGEDGCQGIIIANKSGRQALGCTLAVDASETAVLARVAGGEFAPAPKGAEGEQTVWRTLEFTGVRGLAPGPLSLPAELGVEQATVHRGYRGEDHALVECALRLPGGGSDVFSSTQREKLARRITFDVAAHLLAEHAAFAKAFLAGSSYELHGRHTTRLVGPQAWAQGLALSELAGPVRGVWCANAAVTGVVPDPVAACSLGSSLGQALVRRWAEREPPGRGLEAVKASAATQEGALTVREPQQPQRGRGYAWCDAPAQAIPALRTCDVLVAGGGTSGAIAAMTAARRGMHTVLAEMNPGLGGTGTYGGIHTYWYGRRVGYAAEVMAMVDAMHDRLRHERQSGVLPTWSIEAKLEALLRANVESGVDLALNALMVGAVVEPSSEGSGGKTRVRGVVVATRYGPAALLGEAVIDASGDGDVAAFAGADYVYGAERDHALMYTYMAQVAQPGKPRNVKTSMVDVSNIEDYTRAILDERRRRKERDHDHGIYLAPRESRHIRGEVTLTLTDQLVRRAWPDVVNVAFSNNDIKGQSNSDWVMIGLISPNLEIEIPYRALLPRGLEGIIVAGKAFSATHDALAAPRMQPDIENLGGAAALAAVQAVRKGVPPSAIDVAELQAELAAADALPPGILTRRLMPLPADEETLRNLIAQLDAGRPLHAYSDMELMEVFEGRIPLVDLLCSGPQVVPLLEEAHAEAEGERRVLLAEALALAGSRACVPTLIEAIQAQLGGPTLPKRTAKIRHAGFPPDQNAAPDIAFILHALGAARDPRAIPVWRRIVDLLATATEDEIVDKESSYYFYVVGVCFGAERLGDPAAVPILEQLHGYPVLRQHVHRSGMQPDFLQERMAYLELVIGRALARCGSPAGYVILISYLEDSRGLMAEHAHTELAAITGQDLGKDVAAWSEWLEQQGDSLQPKPWLQASDPVLAWGERIEIVEP
jgi:NADPH-dependent 2,4-dienoyl-CoA reductase/sulfur reductase-like enzyme